MCHGAESRPPVPPGPAEVLTEAGELRLTAADGNEFLAYQAIPSHGTGVAVVLLPDMRGLHEFYRELARRFAESGITALAIDYYGRTEADVQAAVDHVASYGTIVTVGFCVGGAISWSQSAVDSRVAGAIGFYGRPAECRVLIPDMRAPLLVLAAGADVLTPAAEARRFDRELTDAGVAHTFVLYDDAPHSFFDGGLAEHAQAAADAWRRVLDFIAEVTT